MVPGGGCLTGVTSLREELIERVHHDKDPFRSAVVAVEMKGEEFLFGQKPKCLAVALPVKIQPDFVFPVKVLADPEHNHNEHYIADRESCGPYIDGCVAEILYYRAPFANQAGYLGRLRAGQRKHRFARFHGFYDAFAIDCHGRCPLG